MNFIISTKTVIKTINNKSKKQIKTVIRVGMYHTHENFIL